MNFSRMKGVSLVCFLCLSCFLWVAIACAANLGVLAKRGNAVAVKKWGPLAQYLTKTTGTEFKLVPLSFDAIEPALKGKKIDYLITNPGFYVTLKDKYKLSALASLLNLRQGKPLNQFSGVILVKADSPIKDLAGIKGKRFMCVKRTSFGGGQMAFRHMIENGVNPFKDVSTLLQGKKHDNVAFAVKRGVVDAGTVRSDTLERMQAEGKLKLSDFRIIDRVDDDFPFVHSTRLYPEWPFVVAPTAAPALNDKVKQALTGMSVDMPAAKAAKIAGWSEPLDYAPVAECIKIVKQAEK